MTGLRPFFPYYGSKWLAARAYPPPIHRQIVEPFAGSAGYSLRYPDRDVLLVERFATVAALWSWLIAVPVADILSLPDIPPDGTVDDAGLQGPARDLVGYFLTTANVSPNRRPSAWRKKYHGIGWHSGIRRRIADQLPRIRHWQVLQGDFTLAASVVPGMATWFIDPPYSGSAGDKYRGSKPDYPALATWTKDRRGQVIVCENAGAEWLPFQSVWETRGIRRTSREAVYVRYSEVGK
jgi:hypothetical protein